MSATLRNENISGVSGNDIQRSMVRITGSCRRQQQGTKAVAEEGCPHMMAGVHGKRGLAMAAEVTFFFFDSNGWSTPAMVTATVVVVAEKKFLLTIRFFL